MINMYIVYRKEAHHRNNNKINDRVNETKETWK